MTSKELFIQEIEEFNIVFSEKAQEFFNSLKAEPIKPEITEKGIEILKFVKDNCEDYKNIFSAKSVGEGLGKSSKVVSGAMRKLTTDGFLAKIEGSANPVTYKITEKGMNYNFDNL